MTKDKPNDEFQDLAHEDYKERIMNLQSYTTPFGRYHLYEGFWHPSSFLEGFMSLQDNFCMKPTDILLSSPMKAGTTWLKALAFAIITRTRSETSSNQLLTTSPHSCVPNMEFDLLPNSLFKVDPKVPLVATHISYTSLPRSIITSGCKIVYIYRDPKDVFVSLWTFSQKISPKPLELEELFELFVKGSSPYGPFWDHVLSYQKASLEKPETILMLKYEDLMADTEFYVKKLAEFMHFPFSVEEEEDGVMEKLVKLCSFETLNNLNVNKTGKLIVNSLMVVDNSNFFRKGKVGDWNNYLTLEMAERMDKITEEKLGSFGLLVPLKNHH